MGTEDRLTQEAQLLSVCERTFRHYVERLREEGGDGVEALREIVVCRMPRILRHQWMRRYRWWIRYQARHEGWNVRHFYSWYRRDEGQRGYKRMQIKRQGEVWRRMARADENFVGFRLFESN